MTTSLHAKTISRSQVLDLPRPYPDPKLYNGILEEGFQLFPERKENYERYLRSERGANLNYLPVKLDIENVSRCNYRCKMCAVSEWKGGKRAEDMDFEAYKALLDSQYGVVEIKLQGLGEPLMGKSVFDMIRYAREDRKIWVRMTTNGSLLAHNDHYKQLIDADVCDLSVSMDGATADAYEKIRRGGKFDLVTRNAKLLTDYARSAGRDRVRMCSVVQKDNFHQLEQFPLLAADLGFSRMTFSLDVNDWGLKEWNTKNKDLSRLSEMDPNRLWNLVESGKSRGVEVTFWYTDAKYHTRSKGGLCPWPFERLFVSSDMRISPCCMVANPDVYEIGNTAVDLAKTWHGKPYESFRKMHIEGKLPAICVACYESRKKKS